MKLLGELRAKIEHVGFRIEFHWVYYSTNNGIIWV